MGKPDELEQAAALLGEVFEVLETRKGYRNRGDSKLVRWYVKAEFKTGGEAAQATATRVTGPRAALPPGNGTKAVDR